MLPGGLSVLSERLVPVSSKPMSCSRTSDENDSPVIGAKRDPHGQMRYKILAVFKCLCWSCVMLIGEEIDLFVAKNVISKRLTTRLTPTGSRRRAINRKLLPQFDDPDLPLLPRAISADDALKIKSRSLYRSTNVSNRPVFSQGCRSQLRDRFVQECGNTAPFEPNLCPLRFFPIPIGTS
jgi:hypothetical protein